MARFAYENSGPFLNFNELWGGSIPKGSSKIRRIQNLPSSHSITGSTTHTLSETTPTIHVQYIRVSQISKMIYESCTLFHIMPFAKIIGLTVYFHIFFLHLNFEVFTPWTHTKPRYCYFHVFKGDIYQTSNQEKS